MPTEIKCPNCKTTINVDQLVQNELEQKFQKEFDNRLQQQSKTFLEKEEKLKADLEAFEQKRKKENEMFAERIQAEKQKLIVENELQKTKMQEELQAQLRKSISNEFSIKLEMLEKQNSEAEEKLKSARTIEKKLLQLQMEMKHKEAEMEIQMQKNLHSEGEKLRLQIAEQERQKSELKERDYQLKIKEMETQMEAQKKLADDMQRKLDQGSMQLQGEAHELILEETLRQAFPFDIVDEVKKGAEGADCIMTIRNSFGQSCGRIIFESKNAKNWNDEWIKKLKNDKRTNTADVAVIVTKVLPKDIQLFGERDGVWVCSFKEVVSIVQLLRGGILKIHDVQRSQENKGDKMTMLYDYLTGIEFKGQVEAILEAFKAIKDGILKERMSMEKAWKEREKQLEKVLLSTSGMYGSIKGIAGDGVGNIPLLDDTDQDLLD